MYVDFEHEVKTSCVFHWHSPEKESYFEYISLYYNDMHRSFYVRVICVDVLYNLSFEVSWAALINNIPEHFRVTTRLSSFVPISIPTTSLIYRRLEACEMPTFSCS